MYEMWQWELYEKQVLICYSKIGNFDDSAAKTSTETKASGHVSVVSPKDRTEQV